MSINASYFAQGRPEMLALVPEGCTRFLDVGCGEGIFGESLKKIRKCEVWGIEINEDAARQAKQRLNRVIVGDAAALSTQIPESYFDCLIFNDILEHLCNPGKVLCEFKRALCPDGRCLISIPNVRYFENLVALLWHKDWHYTSSGVLDQTHLRFFTRKSFCRFMEEHGFTVLTLCGINAVYSSKNRKRLLTIHSQHIDTKCTR